MKAISVILGICLIVLMFGAILLSLDTFRLTAYEEDHIVTTSGSTQATMVLSQDLYDGDTAGVTVTSNVTNDAPIPSTYATSTNTLTVTGLEDGQSHRLTVSYNIDALGDYWGAQTASRTIPLIIIIGCIAAIGAAIYATTQGIQF